MLDIISGGPILSIALWLFLKQLTVHGEMNLSTARDCGAHIGMSNIIIIGHTVEKPDNKFITLGLMSTLECGLGSLSK